MENGKIVVGLTIQLTKNLRKNKAGTYNTDETEEKVKLYPEKQRKKEENLGRN